ncbi:hypothetical protein O181_034704 [Austropuccinia psidii MF-1]|uniref:Uncharacterized protein n=1 Tax=Austropuccinia psidii MF-1 TaxID=1389203 RepID=A0A9Q3D191_9BASI|nr:hypothetical protein [Austropuccinia psidii MF-1]
MLTILTLAVPSQHASDAPLTLAQSSRPLMILTLLQPPQDEITMPPPISALTTPYAYNSYAPTVPSRYSSDTTLNPPYA